jgi:tungstate transport system substrate-binding protein
MRRTILIWAVSLAIAVAAFRPADAQNQSILVQSTTSTANSGLYDHLLPMFEQATGINVNIVAVGTGQAIRNAQNCDADVLLVHSKPAEEKFVEDGHGVKRHDLMYNDFIIVGPKNDPAGVNGSGEVLAALKKIAKTGSPFASRGDDSGTHQKELSLWRMADVDPEAASGGWYRSTGSGMGATLNIGVGMGAYVLTDRATWISFENKGDFSIAVAGDPALFNQYGVILVNPERCGSMNKAGGLKFIDWLLSEEGQHAIGDYRIDGQQLFFPNADDSNS